MELSVYVHLCNPGSRTNKWLLNSGILNCKLLYQVVQRMGYKVHRRKRLEKEAKEITCHAQMEIYSESLKGSLDNLEFMEAVSKLFRY